MFPSYIKGRWRPYNGVTTPLIMQYSETECGLSALAMLFAYFQHFPHLERLRQQCGCSRDGSRASTLLAIAKSHGFDTSASRCSVSELKKLKQPVIALVNNKHYVVVNGYGREKVFCNDPALGYREFSFDEFEAVYSGIVLAISPRADIKRQKRKAKSWQPLLQALSPQQQRLILIGICLFLGMMGPIIQSSLSSTFIDHIVIGQHKQDLLCLGIIMTLTSLLYLRIYCLQLWHQFQVSMLLSLAKASELIQHLISLPLRFFAIRQKSEISLLVVQARQVVDILAKQSLVFFINSLTAILLFMFMLYFNWRLGLIVIMTTMVPIIATLIFAKKNYVLEKSQLKQVGQFYNHVLTSTRLKESLQAAGLETKNQNQFESVLQKKIIQYDRITHNASTLNAIQATARQFSHYAIVLVAVYQLSQGLVSLGQLLAFLSLHGLFSGCLSALPAVLMQMQMAYAIQLRVEDALLAEPDPRFLREDDGSPVEAGRLRTRQLSFHYNQYSPPILHALNLTICAGEQVALVGATGSGKSTLAKCLCGLYLANKGAVYYDNHDLARMSPSRMSQLFAYVSQDVQLFSGSLQDNLMLSAGAVSSTELQNAIRLACLDDFVASRGLDCQICENGLSLSAGEKQRIEIARAILQNTPVLILDEATAALDRETEQQLIQNLRLLDRTIVYIAHRLSSIQHSHQIIVLDQGQIIERGNHASLMQLNGQYADLIRSELK